MAQGGTQQFLRPFAPADYDLYASWWDGPPPQRTSLPKAGIVAGNMQGVGFVANTDTDISILTYWYANPANTARQSYTALSAIVFAARELSRHMGKKYVFCFTNQSGMKKILKRHGFNEVDAGHLIVEISK